jgi:hypothetical protein
VEVVAFARASLAGAAFADGWWLSRSTCRGTVKELAQSDRTFVPKQREFGSRQKADNRPRFRAVLDHR